jgi:hypothetical protein
MFSRLLPRLTELRHLNLEYEVAKTDSVLRMLEASRSLAKLESFSMATEVRDARLAQVLRTALSNWPDLRHLEIRIGSESDTRFGKFAHGFFDVLAGGLPPNLRSLIVGFDPSSDFLQSLRGSKIDWFQMWSISWSDLKELGVAGGFTEKLRHIDIAHRTDSVPVGDLQIEGLKNLNSLSIRVLGLCS